MVAHVFPQNIPTRVFAGRMFAGGKWQRIEIDSPEALQIPMQGGTAFGVGSLVRVLDGGSGRQFVVIVDAVHLPYGGQGELDRVKEWIPKCAVVLATAVLGRNQPIPESGIFPVAAADYSKDPQRDDARAFRRRCRFDVLNVLTSCLNNNPPQPFCKYGMLAGAETHTRIYSRDDIIDAIQFWADKGFVSLLDRAGDVQIRQTRDEEMMAELSAYSWDEAAPPVPEATPKQAVAGTPPMEYDVFVSHASEDKAAVVVPLTEELIKRGLRVWVYYRELRLGDKLRERIDEGLRRSRFGVVIVSPRFFAKQWPQTELNGLVALEMADGRKRILPIWHDVEYADVAKQSPTLAARLAAKWAEGANKVADEIMRAVRD